MAATTKRKRVGVSKNRKKAWKKHCDINDVEEFLEDQRFDERIGGSVASKPDEQLFFVDKLPAAPKAAALANAASRKLRRSRKLTCFRNLEPSSKVKAPVQPRRVRDPDARKPAEVRETQRQRLAKRLEQGTVDRLRGVARKAKVTTSRFDLTGLSDLWSKDSEEVSPMAGDGKHRVPSHRHQKPSLLPAVEPPHPGTSYNPSHADHQDLLRRAVEVEQRKLHEERRLDRCLAMPNKRDWPTEQDRLAEMSQGLYDQEEDDDQASELTASDGEATAEAPALPAPTAARKTRQQRRRAAEQKRLRREALERKKARVLANDVYRIRTLKAELRRNAEASEARQKRRQQREVDKLYGARRLSAYKYEEPDLPLKLSSELRDSLRELRPEINVLEDRYKSLQRRNVIETRQQQKKVVKYKPKKAVKRSHRQFAEADEQRWKKELQ
ncbi:ribosome biogenesis protein NOP53-like [Dermacentor albipictus]|uniref:ribosome biogenesis protein NOP53-like n=1 Tax=Dermacentor albipictus TaxID=60249 RepID=UPI0038FD1B15